MKSVWEPESWSDLSAEEEEIIESSVPNSSDGLIFVKIRAKDGRFFNKNMGVRRAQRRAKLKVIVILSSFCDLVHAESVVDLFAKQLNNARECAQNHIDGQNHKNTGVRRAIFHKRLSRWAHPSKSGDTGTLPI